MDKNKGWHVWICGGGATSKTDYCFNAAKSARRWASKNIQGAWVVKECHPATQGGECKYPPTRQYIRGDSRTCRSCGAAV